jgi:hypothetical protein
MMEGLNLIKIRCEHICHESPPEQLIYANIKMFWKIKNVLTHPTSIWALWPKGSCQILIHVTSFHLFRVGVYTCDPLCSPSTCKLKIMRMLNLNKKFHALVYMWKWKLAPFIECDVTSAMSCDCSEDLCSVLPWSCGSLPSSMWMSTLCCFPRRQSVYTWLVSGKLPSLWDSGLWSLHWPRLHASVLGCKPPADLNFCNAHPSLPFSSLLVREDFL